MLATRLRTLQTILIQTATPASMMDTAMHAISVMAVTAEIAFLYEIAAALHAKHITETILVMD